MTEAILFDLSAIVHQCWHANSDSPNPNATSIGALDIIRRVAMGKPHAAIACDSTTSLRRAEDATYKANRPKEDRAALYHQMSLVVDALRKDGFPTWLADGYEADDIINSATRAAVAAGWHVRIVTRDKDLLCLVSNGVVVDGTPLDSKATRYDREAVVAKFGVQPAQMIDYLALVGDSSDNIKGCEGVGPKGALELLTTYGTLEKLHAAWAADSSQFTPARSKALGEFWPRVDSIKAMLNLRQPPVPFAEIEAPRVPAPQVVQGSDLEDIMADSSVAEQVDAQAGSRGPVDSVAADPGSETARPSTAREGSSPSAGAKSEDVSLARIAAVVPAAAPQEWEKQLEPRSLDEARMLAKFAFESRLFGAYGSAQAVLMTVMAGRDFGMSAMASLRAFHVVKGKPVLAADAIRALVMRSGKVKFFRCAERTAEKCTFISQRNEDDAPTSLTYTIEEARAAGLVVNGSNWTKGPADMLVARASSKLARIVCPEVTFGLYAPEEMD